MPARGAGPASRRCGIADEPAERVRYALVGCGVMGRQHAWYAYGDPASEVVRYVDADPGRARDLAARYGGTATAEYRAALDDPQVQGVLLTVPDALHAPLGLQALAAGKHVLVEKPIATTLADADALITAAGAAGRVLFVAHVLRFKPALRRVKRLLDAGTLGEPVFARYHHEHAGPDLRERAWLAAPEAGGVFVTGAVHHADLLRWWLGEVRAVTGHGLRVRPAYRAAGQYDHALIVYDFASGALGESTYSYASHQADLPQRAEAAVTGTEGALLQLADGPLHVYRGDQPPLLDRAPALTLPPLGGTGLGFEVPHFTQCVLGREVPAVTPHDARRALELVLAARRSADEGRPFAVPAPAAARPIA